jgi:hypothetical protein
VSIQTARITPSRENVNPRIEIREKGDELDSTGNLDSYRDSEEHRQSSMLITIC